MLSEVRSLILIRLEIIKYYFLTYLYYLIFFTGVELKPDCQVEDSIVLTKGIKDVVEKLVQENFVIVKGVIGSGKSTCLNYIDKYTIRENSGK